MNFALREACGVIGVYDVKHYVADAIFSGLMALQHRGQESAGIAVASPNLQVKLNKHMGLVNDTFSHSTLSQMPGHVGIGHVRYSTIGSSSIENAQPIFLGGARNGIALGHNGNFVNYLDLKEALTSREIALTSSCDAEIFLYFLMERLQRKLDFFNALSECVPIIEGAYSATCLTGRGELVAFRDPLGFRPLSYGDVDEAFIAASESVAIDLCGGKLKADVQPGEALLVTESGVEKRRFAPCKQRAHCMFEYVYFSRPDSVIEGHSVYDVRLKLGVNLAKAHECDADVVIPVPDTSRPAAEGISRQSSIPVAEGLIKNRYVYRTFIMPGQTVRENAVKMKINPLKSVLNGQRVILVDDSIVRGTTIKKLVNIVKTAGARKVHVRITCPPITSPCFYGIDIATHYELIASEKSVEEIRQTIGADSLGYQTIDGLVDAIGIRKEDLCLACLTGIYPTSKGQQLANYMKGRRSDGRYIEIPTAQLKS